MRIVHVIPSLTSAAGGPSRVAIHLAAAQIKSGHEVRVLTRDVEASFLDEISAAPEIRQAILSSTAHSRKKLSMYVRPADMMRVIRSAVVHIHGVWEPLLQYAARYSARCGRATVVTPHGMVSDYGMQKKHIKKRIAMTLYGRSMLESASFVHALTAREAGEIRRYAPGAAVEVYPNGVWPEEFGEPGPDAVESVLRMTQGQPFVLFLARLDHMKGLDILIRAFALVLHTCPDVKLIIAGPDFGFGARCRELVNEFGVVESVQFTGPVYGNLKRALLAGAVCLAQPSRNEGFSVSVLESLASGTPVVISDQVDFPEIIECQVGMSAELSPESVARSLMFFVKNLELRDGIRSRARELITRRYTWDRVAQQLLDGYSDVIRRIPPALSYSNG